jgi:hypothetical protein
VHITPMMMSHAGFKVTSPLAPLSVNPNNLKLYVRSHLPYGSTSAMCT